MFYRIAAGLASAGASVINARIHTTRDGMALDNLLVQDSQGKPYADKRLRSRLVREVEAYLTGQTLPVTHAASSSSSAEPFAIAPSITIAAGASRRTTVVEVNAADRPGLLASLARVIHDLGLIVHSAHIATYGERAVDVFYLTGADSRKLDQVTAAALRAALLQTAEESGRRAA